MKNKSYLSLVPKGRPGIRGPGAKFDFMMLTGARLKTANACLVEHYDPANRTLLLTNVKGRAKTKAPTEERVLVCNELAKVLDHLIKVRKLKPSQKFFRN
jgi:hypothetical protein